MAKLCAPVRDDQIKQLTETTDVIETFKDILTVRIFLVPILNIFVQHPASDSYLFSIQYLIHSCLIPSNNNNAIILMVNRIYIVSNILIVYNVLIVYNILNKYEILIVYTVVFIIFIADNTNQNFFLRY